MPLLSKNTPGLIFEQCYGSMQRKGAGHAVLSPSPLIINVLRRHYGGDAGSQSAIVIFWTVALRIVL